MEAFDWQPLYDKIVVRRAKPKESYDEAGKLQVAEAHQKLQNRGTVVSVGQGRLLSGSTEPRPLRIQEGMEVLFGQHSGIPVDDDPDLVFLREDEILAFR